MQITRNINKEVYINAALLLIALFSGFLIAKLGIIYISAIILLPFLAAGGYLILTNVTFGLMTLISISLFLPFDRYVKYPLGLCIDAVLFIVFFGCILKTKRNEIGRLNYPVFYISSIWFLYCCLEFFNPEAVNRTAWIYACRNLTLHFLLTVTIVLLQFNKEKYLQIFITVWIIGSLAGVAYAFKQYFIGLNATEYAWVINGKTHLIKGVIRIFSFYTDAGIFGATMAFTGLCTLIFSIGEPKLKMKIFYLITSGLTFYAMSLSGTRGAMFVPIVGLLVYMTLVKQIKLLVPTLIILGTTFYILKYTDIGESSFQVSRMRSALNPAQDESFMVRINNQRRLTEYMSSRPFGGGIGSMGFWGKRFSPETFLANTPPDSWYVWIWGETGIVGVSLYILLLLILLTWAMFTILKIRDPLLRNKMLGLFCGTCGIVVASYGNPLLGQIPCNFYIYICFSFFFLSAKWDKEKSISLQLEQTKIATQ